MLAQEIRQSARMRISRALTIVTLAAQAVALSVGGRQMLIERESDGLQNIVNALQALNRPGWPST
jgi:hypothetical protein